MKMQSRQETLADTTSLCPVCLRVVPAARVRRGGQVYLEKECPAHGGFSVLIWNGEPDYALWGGEKAVEGVPPDQAGGCPGNCGICEAHARNTCCLLLEVTQRCNLVCPVCYAASGNPAVSRDPSSEDIIKWYDVIIEKCGLCNIQLSGGEPTVRDDLPEIIAAGKSKGLPYFQLNTNGIRLAEERDYAGTLKAAGLDCVFLQFDAMDDEPYRAIRGRPLLAQKMKAVDACADAGLGVVLVPTLVPGVNDGQVGAILGYAVDRMPDVRGVHFQPLSYFGRYPGGPGARLTIPDVLRLIEAQTNGAMKAGDFKPGTAENPYCSFNGAYLLKPGGGLSALGSRAGCCGTGTRDDDGGVARAQSYVARQWGHDGAQKRPELRDLIPDSLDEYLERAGRYTLAVSGMVFQDPWTADLARLRECYIHVMPDGERVLPFCACNMLHRGN